jgi:phospholipid transport system substrate-binding protein
MKNSVRHDGPARVLKTPWLLRMVILVIVVTGIVLSAPAHKAAASEKYVVRVGKMALAVANGNDSTAQKVADLRGVLQRFSDMKSIALFSLGRYRRKFPQAKLLQYIELMENFVAKFIIGYSKHFAGKRIKIIRSKKRSPSDMIVESQIIYGGNASPAPVKWRVLTHGGRPKIFDVQVRGVWLTLRLRTQFIDVLKEHNGNFDKLFAYLRR